MPITFPLAAPTALSAKTTQISWLARRATASAISPFSFAVQRYHHPGERMELTYKIAPLSRADGETLVAWLLSAGRGTVWLGDFANPLPRGSVAGVVTVGAGAVAGSITLPLSGGSGLFAVGDWIQIAGTLHKVIFVDSATSVQVFPRLRAAHASGTAVTYNNAMGLFMLSDSAVSWDIDLARRYGLTLSFADAVGASTSTTSAN
jgi:hypothetical protein